MSRSKYSIEERYQLILECRNSGLSDYQWCSQRGIKPGTFYNWVQRLREKTNLEIPESCGQDSYAAYRQDVVKVDVVPDLCETIEPMREPIYSETLASHAPIELTLNGMSIKVFNDASPVLLGQIVSSLKGQLC